MTENATRPGELDSSIRGGYGSDRRNLNDADCISWSVGPGVKVPAKSNRPETAAEEPRVGTLEDVDPCAAQVNEGSDDTRRGSRVHTTPCAARRASRTAAGSGRRKEHDAEATIRAFVEKRQERRGDSPKSEKEVTRVFAPTSCNNKEGEKRVSEANTTRGTEQPSTETCLHDRCDTAARPDTGWCRYHSAIEFGKTRGEEGHGRSQIRSGDGRRTRPLPVERHLAHIAQCRSMIRKERPS